MKDLLIRRLRGANRHSRQSVVEIQLDCEDRPGIAPSLLRARSEALPKQRAWEGIRRAAGELAAAADTVPVGFLIGTITAILEENRFPRARRRVWAPPTLDARGQMLVAVETGDVDVTAQAALMAYAVCDELLTSDAPAGDAEVRLSERMQQFRDLRSAMRFNYITHLLANAAKRLDVPTAKLLPNRPYLVLGQGHRRTRHLECLGDSVSAFAVSICKDKALSHELMARHGLPVPAQRVVHTEAQIQAAINELGAPLVVKGMTSDKGISVSTNITSRTELQRAIEKVRSLGDRVLIQRHLPGHDFRFTVAFGKVVAAAQRIPVQVVGDGEQTVTQLVATENQRRLQSGYYASWYVPIRLDEEADVLLAQVGLNVKSVPAVGETVRLKGAQNLSQGGSAMDVTDQVHPDIVRQIERTARVFELNLAGVDVITPDITRPLQATGGAIIEINSLPGLQPHYLCSPPRDVAVDIVQRLFPDGSRGRIPTVGVTGGSGLTQTCRMLSSVLTAQGRVVGTSTTSSVVIGDEVVAPGEATVASGVRTILEDTRTEAAVCELTGSGVFHHGANLDDVDVAVVTNAEIQDTDIKADDLLTIYRLVAQIARQGVVLNADDAPCVAMAPGIDVPVWWVSRQSDNTTVAAHRSDGGNAVVIQTVDGRDSVIHYHGAARQIVGALGELGIAEGNPGDETTIVCLLSILSTIAAALVLDVPVTTIRSAFGRGVDPGADRPTG